MSRWIWRRRILAAFILWGAVCSAGAQAQRENPYLGPIPIRDARPYNLLFLQFIPETGDTLRARADRYDLQLDVINNTLIPVPGPRAAVQEDNEYQRLRFAWRHGLDARTGVGIFVPLEWRNGGVLDGIIKAYHHLLGLPANAQDVPLGRDHYPLYESKLILHDSTTNRDIVNAGNAFGLGETTLTIKRRLNQINRRSAVALRFALKLPTGNPTLYLGSGSADAGLSLDTRYSIGRDIILYGNLGYAVLGRAGRLPGARPNALETLIALEYRPNSRDSFVVQVDGNGQFVRTGNAFADRSNVTATFGYHRVLDRRLLGFISFSEGGHIHDFTLPSLSNVGPEFTLSTGLTWLR